MRKYRQKPTTKQSTLCFFLSAPSVYQSFPYTKVAENHVEHIFGAHLTGDLADAAQRQSQLMCPDGQIVWNVGGVLGGQEMLGEFVQLVEALGDVVAMSLLTEDR